MNTFMTLCNYIKLKSLSSLGRYCGNEDSSFGLSLTKGVDHPDCLGVLHDARGTSALACDRFLHSLFLRRLKRDLPPIAVLQNKGILATKYTL